MSTKFATVELRIGEVLEERNMTVRELARQTELNFESIRRLTSGATKNAPLHVLGRICTVLNCDVSDLLTLKKPNSQG